MVEAYYMIPFWLAILILLRLCFGTYTAILIASVLFGAVELFRATKLESPAWEKLTAAHTVIAHRGGAVNAPENTLAAIREAHRMGIKAVEVDIRISLDGEPVVIHDYTVDRTTNGTGIVSEMTWSQLQQLDASCKHERASEFKGEKIPSLKSVLQLCKSLGLTVYLDLCENSPSQLSAYLLKMSSQYPDLHEWVVAAAFYPNVVYAVKRKIPHLAAILTHRPHVITYTTVTREKYRTEALHMKLLGPMADILHDLAIYHFWWYFCGANGFFMNADVFSVEGTRYWKRRGLDVFVWTVNEATTKAHLRSHNVPYITDVCNE